ncbi:conserved hypothetical protein [delta proteobacterium NaphS2]|nr:conserved hypothetical protein [delta proteobacterium NaphS2]
MLDEKPEPSDAVVVLYTGVEYYPRLMEAASLYVKGSVGKAVINGNRKNDALRWIETQGFKRCCPWYEDKFRILGVLGVPREDIVHIGAEDAYDTVSEAQIVGDALIRKGYRTIILTTSKFHTRRAAFIWKNMYKDRLSVQIVPARTDPYDPAGWWKHGRQIRWVLAEYGAWVYYWWKHMLGSS